MNKNHVSKSTLAISEVNDLKRHSSSSEMAVFDRLNILPIVVTVASCTIYHFHYIRDCDHL